MDIRSGLDGLKSILGVTQPDAARTQAARRGPSAEPGAFDADNVTFSSAASEVAQAASTEGGVRTDKVAGIQAALAAGTYAVPASAVASSMVDAMLGNGR